MRAVTIRQAALAVSLTFAVSANAAEAPRTGDELAQYDYLLAECETLGGAYGDTLHSDEIAKNVYAACIIGTEDGKRGDQQAHVSAMAELDAAAFNREPLQRSLNGLFKEVYAAAYARGFNDVREGVE